MPNIEEQWINTFPLCQKGEDLTKVLRYLSSQIMM